MEHLFIRKKLSLSAEFIPYILFVCFAFSCGVIGFTLIRDSAVGYIMTFGAYLGIEPALTAVIACLLFLAAAYFGMLSTAALVTVPCVCAASGFAVQASCYTYSGAILPLHDFLIFALLVFAYIFSVLFVAAYAMKLSKSIQSCIRSNRALKTELIRYQIIFVLIVILLIVSGCFILT